MFISAESTAFGMSSQPHSEGNLNYRIGMGKIDSKQVLWDNVSRLMKASYGKENLTRLSQDAGIGPGTCTRIKEQSTSVGTDVLEAVAKALKVQPWDLLTPGFAAGVKPAATAGEPLGIYTAVTVDQALTTLADALLKLQDQDSIEAAALFMLKMASDPAGRWTGLLRDLLQKEAGVNGEGKRDTKVVSKKIAAVHNDRTPMLATALMEAEKPVIEGEGKNAAGSRKSSGAQVHRRGEGS